MTHLRRGPLSAWTFVCGVALCLGFLGVAQAQAQPPEGMRLPPAEDVTIRSWLVGQNGPIVDLKATYYASTVGKEAVPVVLLHEFNGSRTDFGDFPAQLQKAGHAVLAVDLRGHGGSTQVNTMNRPLTAEQLRTADFRRMADQDLEAVKRWLMVKHNEGALNIERLTLIGAEMGSVVAVNWAVIDWSWPVLATGKQGQDVRALVLLSPTYNFKGYNITQALNTAPMQRQLSVQIVAGSKNTRVAGEATKMHRLLEGARPRPTNPEDVVRFQSLFLDTPETDVQGTKLLDPRVQIRDRILKFIELRAVNAERPWQARRDPLNG